ncbi:MBL fold metallo-hydrolase [Euzebya pacifica]|uniref:MBL fold metallo-hydrolase n=1 Tax=Euzebya pacifica TaxID=1608957 RepID=UPI0030F74A41
MATLRRLTNSCLTVTDDHGTTLFDPGFFTFTSGAIDLGSIGEVQRVLITHEHGDHVHPDFVRWLLDRGTDVVVHGPQSVADLLSDHGIAVDTTAPAGTSVEDVVHEQVPSGAQPPNRAWTIDGVFTHPGDSYQPSTTAPVLALPLLVPWGSTTASVAFARRLAPQQVVPIHDFYLSSSGREFIAGMAKGVLADDGIELIALDWDQSATL